jgi:hypothetical protein
LRDVIMSTYARGGTALYDAVHATLRRLAPERERKAIVLLSDGGDTASVMDKDLAMQATRTSDVLIYAIGISGADNSVLKSLSKEAGGRAFFVSSADELAETYQQIADELRQQYVLTYASSNPEYDGKWRKLDVDYVGKGSFKVRARRGYYAVRGNYRPLDAEPVKLPPDPAEAVAATTSQADPAAGNPAGNPPAESPPAGDSPGSLPAESPPPGDSPEALAAGDPPAKPPAEIPPAAEESSADGAAPAESPGEE